MEALFASGRIVDLILVLMALEAAALALWRRRTGRGPALAPLLPNLAAGAALLLALRSALAAWPWPATATFLALAGLAHVADLRTR